MIRQIQKESNKFIPLNIFWGQYDTQDTQSFFHNAHSDPCILLSGCPLPSAFLKTQTSFSL